MTKTLDDYNFLWKVQMQSRDKKVYITQWYDIVYNRSFYDIDKIIRNLKTKKIEIILKIDEIEKNNKLKIQFEGKKLC